MTTEIAVSNRLGIALATDSAVTISGNGHVKVFDTADKLFELSTDFPVAVMINGNMDCIGIPWEILVKDFRASQGRTPRDTIQKWADDFFRYVEEHTLISENVVGRFIDQIILSEIDFAQTTIARIVQQEIFESARRNRRPNSSIEKLIGDYLDERAKELEFMPIADSLSGFTIDQFLNEYGARIEALCEQRFKGRQLTSDELPKMKHIVAEALRRILYTDTMTGIVVAGFGSSETFPSVTSVEVDGRVLGKMKLSKAETASIATSPDGGQITSFAQTDVIQRLLGGADPRFVELTADFIEQVVRRVAGTIDQALRGRKLSRKEDLRRATLVNEIASTIRDEYEVETANRFESNFRVNSIE